MDRRAFAEEGWLQILLDVESMKWRPGKFVGPAHWAPGIVAVEAELVFVGEAEDGVERALSTKRGEQLSQGVFALAAHGEVDVLCVKRGLGVEGRKVAAPGNANMRTQAPHLAADFHRRNHLRAGHN